MKKRSRRSFTQGFKDQTVSLIRSGQRTVTQVCKEFGLADSVVRKWLDKASESVPTSDALSSDERQELERLRKEVRVLRTEREILKRAATFFAKENA